MALALALALGAIPASARDAAAAPSRQEPEPPAEDGSPLRPGPGPERTRAALEIGTFLALDFSLLVATPPPAADPPGNVSLWDKLTLKAVGLDTSSFQTNFVLHPLGGWLYYGTARSNRLGALESLGWTAATATTWELLEFRESLSVNDVVVTSAAGASLGECFFRLASWLDGGPPSAAATALAWLLAPMKKINEALDGAAPAGRAPGDSLAIGAAVAGGATRGPGGWSADLRLGLATRLAAAPPPREAGEALDLRADGRLTEVGLDATLAASGLADLAFSASAWLATLARGGAPAGDAGAGGETFLLAGLGLGYRHRLHDWDRTRPGPLDAASVVEVPGILLEVRSTGPARLGARLEAALSFGGTRSLVLDSSPAAVSFGTLPTPMRAWGYYFALGPSVAPALEARYGPAALTVRAGFDALFGIADGDAWPGRSPTAELSDSRATLAGRAAWRLPWGGLEVAAVAEERWRRGRADARVHDAKETSLSLSLGVASE